jgi:hypothetical protein
VSFDSLPANKVMVVRRPVAIRALSNEIGVLPSSAGNEQWLQQWIREISGDELEDLIEIYGVDLDLAPQWGLIQEHYFSQLSRRQTLESSICLPVSGITLLFGNLAAYLRHFQSWRLDSLFADLVVFSFAALLTAGFYQVARSLLSCTYREIADLKDLLHYKQDLRTWAMNPALNHAYCEQKSDQGQARRYAEAPAHDSRMNRRRAAHVFLAIATLITAAVAAGICAIPFFADILPTASSDQQHEVCAMAKQDSDSERPSDAPSKPETPPNQETREGSPGSTKDGARTMKGAG